MFTTFCIGLPAGPSRHVLDDSAHKTLSLDNAGRSASCVMLGWSDDLEMSLQNQGLTARLNLDELKVTGGVCVYLHNAANVKTTPNVAVSIGIMTGDRSGLVKVEDNQMLFVSRRQARTELDVQIVVYR